MATQPSLQDLKEAARLLDVQIKQGESKKKTDEKIKALREADKNEQEAIALVSDLQVGEERLRALRGASPAPSPVAPVAPVAPRITLPTSPRPVAPAASVTPVTPVAPTPVKKTVGRWLAQQARDFGKNIHP